MRILWFAQSGGKRGGLRVYLLLCAGHRKLVAVCQVERKEGRMEKRKWYGTVFAAAAIATLGCWAGQLRTGQKHAEQYEARFAFVAPKRWSKIAQGVAAADAQRGTSTKCILYTQDEASSQADALRYALLSGADGIITGGMEESADTEAVIREAQEAGVPVVYVDSDLETSGRSCYIGSDNYELGKMAGQFLSERCNGKRKLCVIVSYKNNTNQQERLQGLKDAVKDDPDISVELILEGRSSALILEKELPEALRSYPEIDGIVCAEGASSHYCGKILKDNGIAAENYCIVGMDYYQDLAPQVESGVYAALIWQDQYDMGYQAVQYLKDVFDGQERTEHTLHTKMALVTEENLAEYTFSRQQEEILWDVF